MSDVPDHEQDPRKGGFGPTDDELLGAHERLSGPSPDDRGRFPLGPLLLLLVLSALILFAGIHPMEFGFHRALSKRFPFGVYYLVEDEIVRIYAVLDLRRDPAWIRRRLTPGEP